MLITFWIVEMENPLSYIKNTRVNYNKLLEKQITEVLVQFKDEQPSWIPYETLIAMGKIK